MEPTGLITKSICFFWLTILLFSLTLTFPAHAAGRQKLQGHVPAAVTNSAPVGRLESLTQLRFALGLPLRNQAVLDQLVQDLYDPASPNYHHYLTSEQFAEKFGPAPGDYQQLIDFAKSNGLTITATHPNRTLLDVKASVADIERICHVTLRLYQHPKEARTFFAPDVEPSLDLDVPLAAISGLDNYIIPHPMDLRPTPMNQPADANPQAGSGPSGNYIGNDFRAAYAPGVALTGAGQSVGLLEFDGYYASDITAYKNLAGLPNITLTNVLLDGFDGTPGAENDEVALDIDMAMAMAPGLSSVIVYEGGPGGFGNDILNQIATDNVAKQISSSWTFGGVNSTTRAIFQQFATQGQSYFNACGDSGAYAGSIPSPVDVTNIISVGGTTLTTSGPGGTWVSETTWSWFPLVSDATGGGISTKYNIPSWQQGINMTTNKGSTSMRNIPDVALTANNIWVIYNNGTGQSFGGTSCAAPLWAGFIALVNQQAVAYGVPTAGFINPAIYAIGKGTNYASAFHDITTGNNTNSSSPTLFFATGGYDLCTGWGTPTGSNLIDILAPPGLPIISTQPQNQNVVAGAVGTFNVVVKGASPLSYQWQFNGSNLADSGHIAGSQTNTLNISNAQTADDGNYRVIITNNYGSVTSAVATLAVYIAPAITGQPQSLTVPQGSNANFSVGASGDPPLFYQWQFNGGNIASATNTSYTVFNAQAANIGNYSVVVSNLAAAVTSSNAVLTVQVPPAINVQPTNQPATAGGNAQFTVTAVGGLPLSFQWQFNGANLADNGHVLGSQTNVLNLNNVLTNDAGNYRVIITNSFGSITSAVAALTVCFAPVITNQPQSLAAALGSSPSFSVGATGTLPLAYQWQFNSANIPSATSSSYTLANVQTNNQGNYSVTVSNLGGVAASSNANLTVYILPTITNQPKNLTLTQGGSGIVVVGATGTAPLAYQWVNAGTNITGATNRGYSFSNVQTNQAGNYWVVVTNNYGSVTSTVVTLTVLSHPAIATQPLSQSVALGSNATFAVSATGGLLSYQWLFNTGAIAGATGSSYMVVNAQAASAGNYSVVVSNTLGTATSSNAALSVILSPIITSPPSNQTAVLGGSAAFGVTATGAAPLSYHWQFNSGNLADNARITGSQTNALNIAGVLLTDGGAYRVIVTNSYGSTTSTVATLTAIAAPRAFNFMSLVSFAGTNGANPMAALVQGSDGNFYGTTENGGASGQGTVFQWTGSGALNTLYSFAGGNDGANPQGALVQAGDGNLYGTAKAGGTGGAGVVFKISTNGMFTSLYSFTGGGDGANPFAGLLLGSDGNFYGTTFAGGNNSAGTVFKITTADTLNPLYSFTGAGDGGSPAAGLIQGPDGSLYGTTLGGGPNGYGTIFKITTNGAFSSLYAFTNGIDGANPYAGVTLGSDGDLYGAAAYGGPYTAQDTNNFGFGTVFKIIPTNVVFGMFYTFAGNSNGYYPLGGLAQDGNGNFYGTTAEADNYGGVFGKGTIFEMTAAGALTNQFAFNGVNGANPMAALVRGSDGNFYGTTANGGANNNGTIFRLSISAPPPVFQSVRQTNGTVTFTWSATAEQIYQVQYKTDLNAGNWINLGNALGATNGTLSASDAMTNLQRFYRVVLLP